MSAAQDVVEASTGPAPLTRNGLPELLEGVNNPESGIAQSWNVVEAIELLIDAGQFRVARTLANYICKLLQDDDRRRLFVAYAALCDLVVSGELSTNLNTINQVAAQIAIRGHSQADRTRISLVQARAIGLGVAMRALPLADLFGARALIERQHLAARAAGKWELAILSGIELAKTYIYGDRPEVLAARGILVQLSEVVASCSTLSVDWLCDLARLRYQVEAGHLDGAALKLASDGLRSQLVDLGDMARALGELTIARTSRDSFDADALERATEVFVKHGHSGAAAEACLLLAGASAARGHHARAQRFFSDAYQESQRGGSVYVALVAGLGSFHSGLEGGALVSGIEILKELRGVFHSELGMTGFGLSAVAALQTCGDLSSALRLARRVLAHAGAHGLLELEQEALFRVGGCLAGTGDWKGAAQFYRRAAQSAAKRRDAATACEMMISRIQALILIATRDKALSGGARQTALQRVQKALTAEFSQLDSYLELVSGITDMAPLEARVAQVRAQAMFLRGDSVGGVKALSTARERFASVGFDREVAIIDGCLGVALLDVSKTQGVSVLDDALGALQRSQDFFDLHRVDLSILWKVKYYLALTASERSRREAELAKRIMWHEAALSWLEGAFEHRAALMAASKGAASAEGGVPVWDCEFAPELSSRDLDALARSLRAFKAELRPRVAERSEKRKASRSRGQLH